MSNRIVSFSRPCPRSANPVQWHQSMGVARQACARIFRDGGSPAEALAAFGIGTDGVSSTSDEWAHAVEAIAEMLCTGPARRAA